ncbi:hypothetical protein PCE1_001201 [Barthelona sp. PCE]
MTETRFRAETLENLLFLARSCAETQIFSSSLYIRFFQNEPLTCNEIIRVWLNCINKTDKDLTEGFFLGLVYVIHDVVLNLNGKRSILLERLKDTFPSAFPLIYSRLGTAYHRKIHKIVGMWGKSAVFTREYCTTLTDSLLTPDEAFVRSYKRTARDAFVSLPDYVKEIGSRSGHKENLLQLKKQRTEELGMVRSSLQELLRILEREKVRIEQYIENNVIDRQALLDRIQAGVFEEVKKEVTSVFSKPGFVASVEPNSFLPSISGFDYNEYDGW